jgi:hypothetical protein
VVQAAPGAPWPHWAFVSCVTQVLASQQPLGQVGALHVVPPEQRPLWQVWPAPVSQIVQKPPFRPHKLLTVPGRQRPVFVSTQPAQG